MNMIISAAIILLVVVIIAALIIAADKKHNELVSCGETICAEFNQEYRGWEQDTLQCTFNYERFTYPEVDEVFVFIINDTMKERLCNAENPTEELQ